MPQRAPAPYRVRIRSLRRAYRTCQRRQVLSGGIELCIQLLEGFIVAAQPGQLAGNLLFDGLPNHAVQKDRFLAGIEEPVGPAPGMRCHMRCLLDAHIAPEPQHRGEIDRSERIVAHAVLAVLGGLLCSEVVVGKKQVDIASCRQDLCRELPFRQPLPEMACPPNMRPARPRFSGGNFASPTIHASATNIRPAATHLLSQKLLLGALVPQARGAAPALGRRDRVGARTGGACNAGAARGARSCLLQQLRHLWQT